MPDKEYRARIWVKLSDDMLPSPLLSAAELQAHLNDVLKTNTPDSPIVSVAIDDPRAVKNRRY